LLLCPFYMRGSEWQMLHVHSLEANLLSDVFWNETWDLISIHTFQRRSCLTEIKCCLMFSGMKHGN
jgi:hypothetical protein